MAGATPSEQITVRCACGTKLKAPASAVGRKAKCPKCGAVLTVQAAAAEPEPVPLDDDDELDPSQQEEDDLYGLADDPQPAARRGSVAVAAPPPPPGPIGAVRPLDAGGGIPMGTPVGTGGGGGGGGLSPYPPPIRTSVQVQEPEAQPVEGGSYVRGLVLSLAFGSIGSLIWFGLVALTNYEHSWVALGVGLLAGLGMAVGYGSHNALSGVTASAVAVLAIVVGKLMFFVFVLIPMIDRMSDFSDPEGAAERVVMFMAEDELRAKGIDTIDPPEQEWNRAERAAQKKVDAMSAAEITAADDRYRLSFYLMQDVLAEQGLDYEDTDSEQDSAALKVAEERLAKMTPEQKQAELARLVAEYEGAESEDNALTVDGYALLFGSELFGVFDILFMLFALATAFQVATSSGTKT